MKAVRALRPGPHAPLPTTAAQETKTAAARLAAVQAEEAAAREAVRAAKYKLEGVQQRRRALELLTCFDCVKLREFGPRAAACEGIDCKQCVQCELPFCRRCFTALEVCDRCDGRDRCVDCCVDRHGEEGDQSCDDDSAGDGW